MMKILQYENFTDKEKIKIINAIQKYELINDTLKPLEKSKEEIIEEKSQEISKAWAIIIIITMSAFILGLIIGVII